MGNFGTTELIIVAVLLLIFFGAKRIPDLAKGLARGIREFRDATRLPDRPSDGTSGEGSGEGRGVHSTGERRT